jgi:hypothetical protein
MSNEQNIPMPGEYYRHFKGNLYEILTVASHSETGEKLVVYRALYGSHQDYARPAEMFLSEVDHEKYPEVSQQYRFEKVGDCIHGLMTTEAPKEKEEKEMSEETPKETNSDSSILLCFLNAEGLQQKLEVIRENRTKIDQRFIDDAAMALDIVITEGELDDRLRELCRNLQLMAQYEGRRLR